MTDLLNNINIRPVFHSAVLEALKERAKGMSDIEKMIVLSFDEMGLKENISYDPNKIWTKRTARPGWRAERWEGCQLCQCFHGVVSHTRLIAN